MTRSIREVLRAAGLPAGDLFDLPTSAKRFADGAQYRWEIPSTEGPGCFRAVLDEASARGVVVSRVSQGSGVMLLTDADLDEMAELGRANSIEVSLAARPNAGWHTSAMARSSAGALVGATAHGQEQVVQQLADIRRAAAHGVRSVLITDIGTLSLFGSMKASGDLPADMQAKVSVLLPAANAAAARVLSDLGATTINVPTDLSLAELASIRAAVDCPIDIYIESADEFGGILRYAELASIVRVAAPVYLKLGLRNAPDIYPTGGHMNAVATAMSVERVRRARLALEILGREYPEAVGSGVAAAGLAAVVPADAAWDASTEADR